MVDLRIIFMGTPDFAVASLAALVENNWPVVAVITAPDRKKGRGQQLGESPVKQYAQSKNIPVLQPTNLKAHEFVDEIKLYQANLQVVVAFRMLPEVIWAMPALGTFNLHASLLPNYRGAAPINWAIINGEKETGVTTFFLEKEIDTGAIITQEKVKIQANDTVGTLHDRLMDIGSKLVLSTVEMIAQARINPSTQKVTDNLKSAPKIFKETCEIDWKLNYTRINDFIRGLNPYPTAWTNIFDKNCKIFKIAPSTFGQLSPAGTLVTDHKKRLLVRCGDQWAEILDLQLEGKKRMLIEDFLRGNSLPALTTLAE